MQHTTRKLVAGALVTAALVGGALAASDIVKTLEAHYVGVNLVVDGIQADLRDGNGDSVEPFIVNGTTYLPVRTVAEALNQEVKWDGETKTVYIGDIPGQGTNWMKELPPYQTHDAYIYDGDAKDEYFTVAGQQYTTGLKLWDEYNIDTDDAHALWNTNCQYKSMTFTIGHIDGKGESNAPLDIYLDGQYEKTIMLEWDAAPKTYTIDLNYAPNLKFVLNDPKSDAVEYKYAFYGMYDISFQE